jgi:hypothetical protein
MKIQRGFLVGGIDGNIFGKKFHFLFFVKTERFALEWHLSQKLFFGHFGRWHMTKASVARFRGVEKLRSP